MLDHAQPGHSPDRSSSIGPTQLRPPPSKQIDRRALRAWRLSGAAEASIILAIALGMSGVLSRLDVDWYVVAAPLVLAAIIGFVLAWLIPTIRWRRWRYEVSEHEVELQRGVIIVTRTLIPMARVQHVDTKQGPILRHYGLATVEIATAAGTQEIPALAVDVADALRIRISELAGVTDDV